MKIDIKKGIEQEVKIQGMRLKYFYAFIVVCALIFLFIVTMIIQLTRKNSSVTFGVFAVFFALSFVVVLISKVVFTINSQPKKKKDDIHIINIANIK